VLITQISGVTKLGIKQQIFNSNFMGLRCFGSSATNASYSNFFGQSAGQNAIGANCSNFIGFIAGLRRT
jgi:hypothetical protein